MEETYKRLDKIYCSEEGNLIQMRSTEITLPNRWSFASERKQEWLQEKSGIESQEQFLVEFETLEEFQRLLTTVNDPEAKFFDCHMHVDILLDTDDRISESLDEYLELHKAINFGEKYIGCITSFCGSNITNPNSPWNMLLPASNHSTWYQIIYQVGSRST